MEPIPLHNYYTKNHPFECTALQLNVSGMSKRAVFLDRDGIVNELALNSSNGEYESPHAISEVEILPGAIAAAKQLQDAGFTLFLVSNQPSAAKGKVSLDVLRTVQQFIEKLLLNDGVVIARGYYCHHHPEGVIEGLSGPCGCRKPAPGSLHAARDAFGIDLSTSWMIGDQETDAQCGLNAGCRTILVLNPRSEKRRPGKVKAHFTARDLPDAVSQLLAAEGLA
jgi:D-glycero-D-manno-heptose 1,7-bisphosphate phosphatase